MSTDAERSRELTEAGGTRPATKPISEVLEHGADALPPLPVDESAAALELQLQREMDGRQEDRFYTIVIGAVLIDMAVFQHLSWIGIVCNLPVGDCDPPWVG